MDDLISRQAAIAKFEPWLKVDGYSEGELNMLKAVLYELRSLPAAEPKRGKWIYGVDEYGMDGYKCDKCGFFVPWDYTHTFINYINDYNYCPCCGARMEDMRKEKNNGIR